MSDFKDRLSKTQQRRPTRGDSSSRKRFQGIFDKIEYSKKNRRRFVGKWLEVRTHSVGPQNFGDGRGQPGLLNPASHDKQTEGYVPKLINCGAWDIERQDWKKGCFNYENKHQNQSECAKHCVVCKLNYVANCNKRIDGIDEAEKKKWDLISQRSYPRTSYKWNCINRDDPYVELQAEDGTKQKVLGLKVLSLGIQVWDAIEAIMYQYGDSDTEPLNIADPQNGLDIIISKEKKSGNRTDYGAEALSQKNPNGPGFIVAPSPLTEEESALVPHDMKILLGKAVEQSKVRAALLPEYLEVIEAWEEEAGIDPSASTGATSIRVAAPQKVEEDEPSLDEPSLDEPSLDDDTPSLDDDENPACFGAYEKNNAQCEVCPVSEKCNQQTGKA